jgi:tetratricopeptide (TPR) repeat protein
MGKPAGLWLKQWWQKPELSNTTHPLQTIAEPLYLEGLAIARKSLPKNHPDLAIDLNNLAGAYYAQGKYKEAEPLYLEALAIARESLIPSK